MVVDGFMDLYEAGIIKRKVYDDLVIQRLINEHKIDETITPATLDLILMRKGIHHRITEADFDYLRKFGIFRRNLTFDALPGDLAGSEAVFAFLANEISKDTYLNLMDQYRPCYRADEFPPLDRPLRADEYRRTLDLASEYGLRRLDNRHGWRRFFE